MLGDRGCDVGQIAPVEPVDVPEPRRDPERVSNVGECVDRRTCRVGGVGDGDGQSQATPTEGDPSTSPGIPGMTEGKLSAPAPCIDWLDTLPVKLGLVLGVLLVAGIVAYRTKEILFGLMLLPAISFFTYFVYLILTACGTLELNFGGGLGFSSANQGGNNSSGGSMGQAADAVASQPSLLLGIILVVIIAAAIVLLVVATGDSGEAADEQSEPEPEPEMPNISAVGRAAGAAADRIAGEADAGNEVYRAWAEMTEYLAVDGPESSTPAEFAEAAIDAGMAPDDVRELTALFEEVRYGTEAATEDRESRAVAALRRRGWHASPARRAPGPSRTSCSCSGSCSGRWCTRAARLPEWP